MRPREPDATDPFRALLKAVIEDDREAAKGLLKKDPRLAMQTLEGQALLVEALPHWLYVGDTALHAAAAGHRAEIVKLLLAAGADANAAANHRISRPLHYAADGYLENPSWDARRQVATIQLLLEAGADIHAPDKNGATPLHRAVRTRCAAAVRCLLAAGSDATAKNKPGSTPFHLAVQNTGRGGSGAAAAKTAQREIIRAFLQRGVNPALPDEKGKSVLQWARSDWVREMLTNQ